MKRLFFATVLSLFALTLSARAQSAEPAPTARTWAYDQWTPDQWRALRAELTAALRVPVRKVDQRTLQDVIYFETHYPEAMDLDGAADDLLWISEHHPKAPIRILAIAALHAVSEPEAMRQLAQVIQQEPSDTARHIGTAAVADFYRNQR